MGRFAIDGALFIFLSRGQKLEKRDAQINNFWPDNRYVLWPRAQYWDVRYLDRSQGKQQWLPIAEKPFPDESSAWLAAYGHWQDCLKTKGVWSRSPVV